MDLTTSQISEYLLSNAFCNVRDTASNRVSTSSSVLDTVKTDSLTETLNLLSGSSDNLDDVITNLNEMLDVANSVTAASTDDERNEAYARLRSLASGMDDIIDETTFNEQVLFDGSQLDLTSAGSYSRMVLSDLTATSDDMDLAESNAGAEVEISYDDFCTWNNEMVDLSGLDISEARSTDVNLENSELDTGQYVLKVEYEGAKSSISILDNSGNEVSRVDDVDLSGSGLETVTFDCGVELDIEKTRIAGSLFDKYDYENKGTAVLYADLDYTRVNTFDLSGSQDATSRSATLSTTSLSTAKEEDGGKLSITKVGYGVLAEADDECEDGTYNIEMSKIDDKAYATMYDTSGKVVASVASVDLNDDGTTSLDFGNGVVISVDNDGFDGNTTLKAMVQYTRATNPYDDFDFDAYVERIQAAVDTVTEQQEAIDEAYSVTESVYEAIQGTLGDNVYSTTSQVITNLLGGSSSSTSAISILSGSSSSNTGLEWASSLITDNLSTALGLSSGSGTDITSLLGGTVDTLDPTSLPTTISYHA